MSDEPNWSEVPSSKDDMILSDNFGRCFRVFYHQNAASNLETAHHQQQQQHQASQQQAAYELFAPNNFHQISRPPPPPVQQHQQSDVSSNFFINQLVGNWAPGTSIHNQQQVIEHQPPPREEFIPPPLPSLQQQQPQRSSPQVFVEQQQVPKPKPRIVAEVKPWTDVSYADVLSKNVPAPAVPPTKQASTVATAAAAPVSKKGKTTAVQPMIADKEKPRRSAKKEKAPKAALGTSTVSSTTMNDRELLREKTTNGGGERNCKKKATKKRVASGNAKPMLALKREPLANNRFHSSSVEDATAELDDGEAEQEPEENDSGNESDVKEDAPTKKVQLENVYNVRKTENYAPQQQQPRKPKSAGAAGSTKATASTRPERTSGKRSVTQRGKKPQSYATLRRMVETWVEWLLKALNWLWTLVLDVLLLSASLVWEKLCACGGSVVRQGQRLCDDFRASASTRQLWRRFDRVFARGSRWAFWRRAVRREETAKSQGESRGGATSANGKLPSTAEEAMANLLNCSGKDAYSILGVTPEASQEQIRKNYKKIAVLVHPDKNKQPGAEEAFKVLQRSFELIGEPENRQKYDQSIAEALHAEKAWTELNDLLKQLQTKIAEAANTIRCSSCSKRHPRKPTDRPHFAARECGSCKIRHAAREGDIWAERGLFGLRWKYLALMEGKVYEITEWAACQKGALAHLQPNSHVVQYRIVLGQSAQQPGDRAKRDMSTSEPTFDDILSNIYGGQNQQTTGGAAGGSTRRRGKKSNVSN